MGPNNPIFTSDTKSVYDPVEASKTKKLVANKIAASGGNKGKGGRPIVGSNGTQVSRATIERLSQGKATRQERTQFYQDLAGYSTFDVKNAKDKVFEDIVEAFEDEIWKQENENLLSQIRRTDDNAFDDFDIYVAMGDYANKKANHTVQKLVGVRLTSQGKTVTIGGGNIQEEYQFIARTVV
jgi:hypothetical protein